MTIYNKLVNFQDKYNVNNIDEKLNQQLTVKKNTRRKSLKSGSNSSQTLSSSEEGSNEENEDDGEDVDGLKNNDNPK